MQPNENENVDEPRCTYGECKENKSVSLHKREQPLMLRSLLNRRVRVFSRSFSRCQFSNLCNERMFIVHVQNNTIKHLNAVGWRAAEHKLRVKMGKEANSSLFVIVDQWSRFFLYVSARFTRFAAHVWLLVSLFFYDPLTFPWYID